MSILRCDAVCGCWTDSVIEAVIIFSSLILRLTSFTALLLQCIIVSANRKVKNGVGLGEKANNFVGLLS